jgi:hypothetical protein
MNFVARQWGKWIIGALILAYFATGIVFAKEVAKSGDRAPAAAEIKLGNTPSSWFTPSWQHNPHAMKLPPKKERRFSWVVDQLVDDSGQSPSQAFKKQAQLKSY